jgi:hypothetical protein
MNEQEFKQQIITNFIATYCAINYDDMCARNKDLENYILIEDAEYVANKAWENWIKLKDNNMKHASITFDWRSGPIPKDKQQVVEVTSDLAELVENGNAVMLTLDSDNRLVVYTDDIKWRFKQR